MPQAGILHLWATCGALLLARRLRSTCCNASCTHKITAGSVAPQLLLTTFGSVVCSDAGHASAGHELSTTVRIPGNTSVIWCLQVIHPFPSLDLGNLDALQRELDRKVESTWAQPLKPYEPWKEFVPQQPGRLMGQSAWRLRVVTLLARVLTPDDSACSCSTLVRPVQVSMCKAGS